MSIEPERERIVEQLSAHFAEDHLTTQELEDRFERAYRATDVAELRSVVAGLPALGAPLPAPKPVSRTSAAPARRVQPDDSRRYLAVMSTFRREGDWTPNRVTILRAIMADVHIDLRDATFVDREIEIDLMCFMASVQIFVPPGVRVECDGFGVMGEFSGRSDDSRVDDDAPTVRVRGSAIMGSVKVETRLPGESRLAAWRRRRQLGRGNG